MLQLKCVYVNEIGGNNFGVIVCFMVIGIVTVLSAYHALVKHLEVVAVATMTGSLRTPYGIMTGF